MKPKTEVYETPAYVSFKTLEGFLYHVHETALPGRIDRSMMPSMSGAAQSHILSAMKFLRLISASGDVEPSLRELMQAWGSPENRKRELAKLSEQAYKDVIKELDLATATDRMLREKFAEQGLKGGMLDRCMRFYLRLRSEAGLQTSTHIGRRKVRGSQARSTERTRGSRQFSDHGNRKRDVYNGLLPPQQSNLVSFPLPGRLPNSVLVPQDLKLSEVRILNTMLEAYVGSTQSGKVEKGGEAR